MLEFEAILLDAIRQKLGGYPQSVLFDDKFHHFHTGSSNKKNLSGWYNARVDGDVALATFGDFRTGEHHSFCSKTRNQVTHEEWLVIAEKRRKYETAIKREEKRVAKQTMAKAAKLCDKSKAVRGDTHPYMRRKQIKNYTGVGVAYGCLIIPAYRGGEMVTAQMIGADGVKRFLTGKGTSKDAYHRIGDFAAPDKIIVCEGFATGASLYEATGIPTVIAFNTGNLPGVVRALRKEYPLVTIIICADNDESEAGLNAAKKAIESIKNAVIKLCPVRSDYNDLHVQQGIQAVHNAIFPPPAPVATYSAEPVVTEQYKPNRLPFRVLGRADGECVYMLPDGQLYEFAPHSHNKQVLLALAPLELWESMASNERGGIAVDECVSWLLRQSERVSFNPLCVRGRGAWIDGGKIILHQGEEVLDVATGSTVEAEEYDSHYIYPRKAPIGRPPAKPLSDNDAMLIYDIFCQIPTETVLQRQLLAGWVVCSQICGALDWRPHIWLTGAKSTGKSWVVSRIIKPLMGDNVLFVQSSTTEAGIRQTLGGDALPVLFDEAEGNSERSRGNIQRVLELARQASSSDGGMIAKGSQGGDAVKYNIRSCFCFSSIIDGVVQNSDRSRITAVEIDKRRYGSDDQYRELSRLRLMLTDDVCAGFYWRIVGMAATIRHNARVIGDLAAVIINDTRAGEQIGALLSGLHALMYNHRMTTDEAQAWVSRFDLSPYIAAYAEQDDGEACLHAIMSAHIEHGDRRRNVGDMLQRMTEISQYDDDWSVINKSLAAKGLKVNDDHRLCIANMHEGLRGLLLQTSFAVGWDKVISRLPGALREKNPVRFGGVRVRSVSIDLKAFFRD